MAKRVPLVGVILTRNGRQVMPPVGKVFDFTDDELQRIKSLNPKALRTVVNEGEDADVEATEGDLVANKPAQKPADKAPAATAKIGTPTKDAAKKAEGL